MREWLTVIVALLILAVVLDGLRRMRQARRGAIRMSAKVPAAGEREAPETYGSELPNGGARVVNVRKADDAQQLYKKIRQTREEKKRRLGRPNRIPEQVALNLDEHVPTLMEVEQERSPEKPTASQANTARNRDPQKTSRQLRADRSADDVLPLPEDERIEPRLSMSNSTLDELDYEHLNDGDFADEAAASADTANAQIDDEEYDGDEGRDLEAPAVQEAGAGRQAYGTSEQDEDPFDDFGLDNDDEEEYREPELVLVINVMAPKGEHFRGDVLLETVLQQGMRFGSMNIFHHHTNANGKGAVLYSMANIVVPGTFDLGAMKDGFTTPGVSLFLALPIDADSSRAFESMLSTARAIARMLGGELKDENRSVMTAQTIEHYRSRIKEFERKQLSRHA